MQAVSYSFYISRLDDITVFPIYDEFRCSRCAGNDNGNAASHCFRDDLGKPVTDGRVHQD
jgi:hypothetical protein